MKSRLSLKNLAKLGLNLLVVVSLLSGCTSSTVPTYLKENLDQAIQDICKTEYNIEVKVRLVGKTLWIYLPLEDILVKSDKPEKYLERFEVENSSNEFKESWFRFDYSIKAVPEAVKYQEYSLDKVCVDKINNVWKVLRRALFSMGHSKNGEPKFFCLVSADVKNGFQIKETFYYPDLKKVSYEFISWGEFQHRTIQESEALPGVIGDKEGLHLEYKDISLADFIAGQIQHRIKLKFGKPEVKPEVDIDKEIIKIIVYTLKIYQFRDFTAVELNNLFTKNKITLNEAALWMRPTE